MFNLMNSLQLLINKLTLVSIITVLVISLAVLLLDLVVGVNIIVLLAAAWLSKLNIENAMTGKSKFYDTVQRRGSKLRAPQLMKSKLILELQAE